MDRNAIGRESKPAINEVERCLAPDVVRIRYDIGEDWSGQWAIFFRVVLTDEAARRHGETRLLANLARGRVGHRFADIHGAARQSPLAAVRALLQQKTTTAIEDDGGDAGPDPEGALVVTLEGDHRDTVPDAAGVCKIRRR